MTLTMPKNTTSDDVARVVKSAISKASKVPIENLVVKVIALPMTRRRVLLQETNGVRFAVEVRVLFPVEATTTEVSGTKSRLIALNSVQLDNAIQTTSTGTSIRVLESGSVEIDKSYLPTSAPPTTSPTPSPSESQSDDFIIIAVGASVGGFVVILCLLFCICRGSMPGH